MGRAANAFAALRLPVAPVGEAMRRINNEASVSSLFD
jgi:hypothetical protein